jgi:hypothetical protein
MGACLLRSWLSSSLGDILTARYRLLRLLFGARFCLCLCLCLEGRELGINLVLVLWGRAHIECHIHTGAYCFVKLASICVGIGQGIKGTFHGVTLKGRVGQESAESGSATLIRPHKLVVRVISRERQVKYW